MRLSIQRCLILGLCLVLPSLGFSYSQIEGYRAGGSGENPIYGPDPASLADSYLSCPSTSEVKTPTRKIEDYTVDPDYLNNWQTHSKWRIDCTWPAGNYAVVMYVKYVEAVPEPSDCFEQGQIYDPQLETCVLDCSEGQLNGVCLQGSAQNNDTCNVDSPDYQGFIDFGAQKKNICESQTQCDGGSFGVVNGVPSCIPDEYGPPTCSPDAALVIDEYGFVCESLQDAPEEPEPVEEPNTDTDGDGTPDEYQRENDPNSTDKAVDRVADAVGESNEQLDQANNRLDKIGEALGGVNDNLNDGLGTLNQSVVEIKDSLQAPEGGFDSSGFDGVVPTFSESSAAFKSAVMAMPAISSVADLASLPESTTCPIYTLPSTPISGPIVMDIHCGIINDYRGVISGMFLFFWVGIALFLFLRA